jgi:large subunit ribosomal protein L25
MKTTEIVGFKREGLGTSSSKVLRADGNAPCVVYGSSTEPIHFHAPMYLFRELLYTPNAYIVNLNIEGTELKCILKDVQFHPVSETILHVDFLVVSDDKPVTIDIPIEITGTSKGVANGGKLFTKVNKLKVKALIADLPDYVEVSIEGLGLGKSVRVGDVKSAPTTKGFEILNHDQVTIASVIIPRVLKQAGIDGEEEEEEA